MPRPVAPASSTSLISFFFELLLELARDRAVGVEGRRAQERRGRRPSTIQRPRGSASTPPVVSLLVPARVACARELRDREPAERRVPDRPREVAGPLREALRALALVVPVEDRLGEAPECIRRETDGEHREERLAERLLGDLAERSLLVGALLACRPVRPSRRGSRSRRTGHPGRRGRHGRVVPPMALCPARRPFAAIDPTLIHAFCPARTSSNQRCYPGYNRSEQSARP